MLWDALLQLEALLKLFPVASYRNLTLQCLSEVSDGTCELKLCVFVRTFHDVCHCCFRVGSDDCVGLHSCG